MQNMPALEKTTKRILKQAENKMDYKKLLEHSFDVEKTDTEDIQLSRFEYLSEHIFDFITYDSAMSDLFGRKAVEVCAAINNQETFDHIKNDENYQWFLIMVNMPFFYPRLDWGGSIRGAWWDTRDPKNFEIQSCGLWDGDRQITEPMGVDIDQWKAFISAIIEFAYRGETESVNEKNPPNRLGY